MRSLAAASNSTVGSAIHATLNNRLRASSSSRPILLRTRSARVGGKDNSVPAVPSLMARPSSRAKNGLPPEISAMRSTVGRENVRPRRSEITVCSCRVSNGRTAVRFSRSGRSRCSQVAAAPSPGSQRSVTSTPNGPRRRRTANSTAARLELSSHCVSSIATITGECSASACSMVTNPAATTRWSVAGPSAPARSRTRSSARRCRAGSRAKCSGSTSLSRSASAAKAITDSVWPPRADSTLKPRSRASWSNDSHSVVLPIPACPSMTRPVGLDSAEVRKPATCGSTIDDPPSVDILPIIAVGKVERTTSASSVIGSST